MRTVAVMRTTGRSTGPAAGAAATLKALREEAGLTVAEMAAALGRKKSSYQHYEDRYKRPYLPPDLAEEVAAVLREHGISPTATAELTALPARKPPLEADLLRTLIEEVRLLRREVRALNQTAGTQTLREDDAPFER